MSIDPNNLWAAGKVRIRATAPDPFAGLRGRAYIAARGLGRVELEPVGKAARIATTGAVLESLRAAPLAPVSSLRELLLKRISASPASPAKVSSLRELNEKGAGRLPTYLVTTGARDYLPENNNRRFWIVVRRPA